MREDEYHEVQILEAEERLQEEINYLLGKAYHYKVSDRLGEAEALEAEASHVEYELKQLRK